MQLCIISLRILEIQRMIYVAEENDVPCHIVSITHRKSTNVDLYRSRHIVYLLSILFC